MLPTFPSALAELFTCLKSQLQVPIKGTWSTYIAVTADYTMHSGCADA